MVRCEVSSISIGPTVSSISMSPSASMSSLDCRFDSWLDSWDCFWALMPKEDCDWPPICIPLKPELPPPFLFGWPKPIWPWPGKWEFCRLALVAALERDCLFMANLWGAWAAMAAGMVMPGWLFCCAFWPVCMVS